MNEDKKSLGNFPAIVAETYKETLNQNGILPIYEEEISNNYILRGIAARGYLYVASMDYEKACEIITAFESKAD
jgi:hypothetical protein